MSPRQCLLFPHLWQHRSNREVRSVTETLQQAMQAVELERRSTDRREDDGDRRQESIPVAVDRRKDERRKTQRRRQIDPTTCERDYTSDEIDFMQALDAYKRRSGRMFPTCSEILEVVRSLGYVKLGDNGETTPAQISGSPQLGDEALGLDDE